MAELLTVKAVENKTTKDNKAWRRVQDQKGRWLSLWGSDEAIVGQTYLAECKSQERNGQTWWQIDSLMPHANGSPNGAPTAAGDKDANIARSVALYAATYTLRGINEAPASDAIGAFVLRLADQYLAWLSGKGEPEEGAPW